LTDKEPVTLGVDVSRGTSDRLEVLLSLVQHWNRTINLVSRVSLDDGWRRHVVDSAQLWRHRPPRFGLWRDLGAGAGFPGLVIAIIAAEAAPSVTVELVESDQRKVAFLVTAARTLNLTVVIRSERIEAIDEPTADVLSARALAPLASLLAHTKRLRRPDGIALFPKGETVHKELAEAERNWSFAYRLHPSQTGSRSAIVEVGRIDGPR
jgi:16S rRNA (guanine527-N7)-methyltransferase